MRALPADHLSLAAAFICNEKTVISEFSGYGTGSRRELREWARAYWPQHFGIPFPEEQFFEDYEINAMNDPDQ